MSALQGIPLQRIWLSIPRYGIPTAILTTATPLPAMPAPGSARIELGDITALGTIRSGDDVAGSGVYYWAGGMDRWRLPIPAWGYFSPGGVKRSVVLGKLFRDAGEPGSVNLPEVLLGPNYARVTGAAEDTLRRLAVPWFVDLMGMTQIGERAGTEVSAEAELTAWDPSAGTRTIVPATHDVAAWLPGNTINGEIISKLEICADAENPLRLLVSTGPDVRTGLDRAVSQRLVGLPYLRLSEYRVVSRNGSLYDLRAERLESGMPDLTNVECWPGSGGLSADLRTPSDPQGASSVLVAFRDGSDGRAVIVGTQPPGKAGGLPLDARLNGDRVSLGDATRAVARKDDPVTGVSITSTISPATMTGTLSFQDAAGALLTMTFTAGTLSAVTAPVSLSSYVVGTPTQEKVFA